MTILAETLLGYLLVVVFVLYCVSRPNKTKSLNSKSVEKFNTETHPDIEKFFKNTGDDWKIEKQVS
jgi:hypothetical protein